MANESPKLPAATGDLDPEILRSALHSAADWVADYIAHPERHAVLSRAEPGDLRGALPARAPAGAEPLQRIMDDFERLVLPGITHWNHPGFFAYFSVSASAPGILAELLTAALNVNAMLWKTSPAATELEEVALGWLRDMLGLPSEWFGVITDTASISTLLALAAAREASTDLAIRERGMAGRADLPVLRMYASDQAHSSVDKAAITLGLGRENVIRLPSDEAFRMRADALASAGDEDRAAGRRPLAVVATTGTTSTTSVDPVRAIAEICRRERMWLHVDAAYGGAAAVAPEMRWVLDGAELADSLVVNPHKWLFTPIDCSALYVKDGATLKRAFSLIPDYLVTARQGEVIDYMDYGVQLGHRFRALKLWMVIRAFGAEGIASRVRAHCAIARELAQWIAAEPGWRVVAPVPLSVVCFRCVPDEGMSAREVDALNESIMHRVNASGEAYLSHTKLNGAFVLRLAIGNIRTERSHVARAWDLLREAAAAR
ncbi:MAG: pyridoxal-dependent decarboxylase [Gemmatimonadota bacterium]|nr:pyridoxal-dependent decarboxylase [Gemmatimonadota bacterium]